MVDVDGVVYADLCLGDTGAMTGHSPPATVAAVRDRVARGITAMLPTEDAIAVGEEMKRRFGLPRLAVHALGHRREPVRDPARARRSPAGRRSSSTTTAITAASTRRSPALTAVRSAPREGNVGPPVDPAQTTRDRRDQRPRGRSSASSATGDVACVLIEPALTNIGIVLADDGYHERLRELTREAGTLLVIDETHTLCCGPGGYTGIAGLEPDLLTIGKPIGGGIPIGAYGLTTEVAERILEHTICRRRRRRRGRRDAGGQRALARRRARDPDRGAHRGGVRAHDRARRAVRARGRRDDLRA